MSHNRTSTALSLEPLDRFSLLYQIGSSVRHAGLSDAATHVAPRDFQSGVSSACTVLQVGSTYRGVLSANCSFDQMLRQDSNGLLSPVAGGPEVGRAVTGGTAGDEIEFIFAPPAGTGGGGTPAERPADVVTAAGHLLPTAPEGAMLPLAASYDKSVGTVEQTSTVSTDALPFNAYIVGVVDDDTLLVRLSQGAEHLGLRNLSGGASLTPGHTYWLQADGNSGLTPSAVRMFQAETALSFHYSPAATDATAPPADIAVSDRLESEVQSMSVVLLDDQVALAPPQTVADVDYSITDLSGTGGTVELSGTRNETMTYTVLNAGLTVESLVVNVRVVSNTGAENNFAVTFNNVTGIFCDPVNGQENNPGTYAQPFQQMQHGINAASDDTDVWCKPGNYNFHWLPGGVGAPAVQIRNRNAIRLRSITDSGSWATIDGTGFPLTNVIASASLGLFEMYNCTNSLIENVEVKESNHAGMAIRNDNLQTPGGSELVGANNEIRGCWSHDHGTYGIIVQGRGHSGGAIAPILPTGCKVMNNVVNTVCTHIVELGAGFASGEALTHNYCDGCETAHNLVYDYYKEGIQIGSCSNIEVHHNRVRDHFDNAEYSPERQRGTALYHDASVEGNFNISWHHNVVSEDYTQFTIASEQGGDNDGLSVTNNYFFEPGRLGLAFIGNGGSSGDPGPHDNITIAYNTFVGRTYDIPTQNPPGNFVGKGHMIIYSASLEAAKFSNYNCSNNLLAQALGAGNNDVIRSNMPDGYPVGIEHNIEWRPEGGTVTRSVDPITDDPEEISDGPFPGLQFLIHADEPALTILAGAGPNGSARDASNIALSNVADDCFDRARVGTPSIGCAETTSV